MSFGEKTMCKFFNELENITSRYGKEMLNENGQKLFGEMPLDSKIRFIVSHTSQ